MTDWDERIPAAIARGEEGVAVHEKTICAGHDNSCVGCMQDAAVGPLAVALAKALWRVTMAEGWHTDPALREFTEKIEQVDQ